MRETDLSIYYDADTEEGMSSAPIMRPNGNSTVCIGIHTNGNLVKSGEVYRFGRGLYVVSSMLEDDFYLLQQKYGRGIYLHGYSDRTPAKYTMTFPQRDIMHGH